MSAGKHNKKEFNEFMRLRKLIAGKPRDVTFLRQELSENYYHFALISLSALKRHMPDYFIDNFFGKATRKFFGTRKYAFSKKDMTVTCYNEHTAPVYAIVWEGDDLSLRIV